MASQNNLGHQYSIASNLVEQFNKLEWFKPNHLMRSFVRYRNGSFSPGDVRHLSGSGDSPLLSVIIPTTDADRGGRFWRLLEDLSCQTFQDFELIVIKGDDRQGRAINTGADLAQGKYLLTVDDDSSLPDRETFGKMIEVMEAGPDISMAGASNITPQWATAFQKRVMQQIPRRSWTPVNKITDSDLAEHGCLIIRKETFWAVGGENELIPRGLDPYLRKQFRDIGARVVLVPRLAYHHLPPDTWSRLVTLYFRNGYQAAYVNLHYPQWVIETPRHHGEFVEQIPLWKRLLRYPFRMLASLFSGRWIWLSCQISYGVGFLAGWFKEWIKQK